MSKVLITRSKLDGLATTIAAKSGATLPLTIAQMDTAVDGITTGVDTSSDTVDAAHLLDGYTAHDSMGAAITGEYVAPSPTLQAKTRTISAAGTFVDTPDSGYDGLSSVTTTVPSASFYVDVAGNEFFTDGPDRRWHIRGTADLDVSEGDTEGWHGQGTQFGNYVEFAAVPANTTVTPTTSAQTIGGANHMMEGAVTVAAMPSGTAGTPTATKGSVSNHSVSVTPSVTNTTGYITGGTKTGTAVSVSASELVSGNKAITANGSNIDVTDYATVSVNVSGGSSMNVQVAQSTSRATSSTYTSVCSLTCSTAGTYDVYWDCFRSTTGGTSGSQLYIGGNSYGSANTTFSNHVQTNHLQSVSLSLNQKIRVYGRNSRNSSYYIYSPMLTIVED